MTAVLRDGTGRFASRATVASHDAHTVASTAEEHIAARRRDAARRAAWFYGQHYRRGGDRLSHDLVVDTVYEVMRAAVEKQLRLAGIRTTIPHREEFVS